MGDLLDLLAALGGDVGRRLHRGQALDRGLARLLHRLLDGDRHFTRLAVAEADLAGAVADDGQRGEGELATALDGLGDAVDRDQLLDEAVVAFAAIAIAFVAAHWFLSW